MHQGRSLVQLVYTGISGASLQLVRGCLVSEHALEVELATSLVLGGFAPSLEATFHAAP